MNNIVMSLINSKISSKGEKLDNIKIEISEEMGKNWTQSNYTSNLASSNSSKFTPISDGNVKSNSPTDSQKSNLMRSSLMIQLNENPIFLKKMNMFEILNSSDSEGLSSSGISDSEDDAEA